MTSRRPASRTLGAGLIALVDDFMSWLLYGYETWLVALLKGVPLFLYVYFLLTYVPNYVYYLVTQYIPFLGFSPDVGFIIAQGVGGGNFLVLIILAVWTQAARGRRGFAWTLIRLLDFLQLLFSSTSYSSRCSPSTWRAEPSFLFPGQSPFPLQAIAFGTLVAGLGLASLVYLYFDFRRVTRREALLAESRSTALQAR